MKSSDFQIHSTEKLDKILVHLSEMIIDGQKKDSSNYGMVAACVLDTKNRAICGVNHLDKDNKRVHAERVAVDGYLKKYGEIPEGSIIISTLSPCSEFMADRQGDSCTDLVNDLGLHKVYCGYKDPSQSFSEKYLSKRFHVKETRNAKLRSLCKAFADTFLKDAK